MLSKNQSGLAPIVIVLIIAVLVVGGGYWIYDFIKNPIVEEHPVSPEDKPPTLDDEEPADETANWQTYRNIGYGYEIKCPKGWLLGAVARGDMGGGLFNVSQEWAIEPAPVFEVTPEKLPNLLWIIKDEKGITQLRLNIEYKTKLGNISLEQFAQNYPTPKDKITNLTSEKILLDDIEIIKQLIEIDDPNLKSGPWYYISANKYFFILISRQGSDSELIDRIISTFKFVE